VTRYIHLNPVRAKIVARPEEYPWSSYRAYAGLAAAPGWLQQGWILSRFGADEPNPQVAYRDFVEGQMGQEQPSPLEEVVASTPWGSRSFAAWVELARSRGGFCQKWPFAPAARLTSRGPPFPLSA
jgi:putative transposase